MKHLLQAFLSGYAANPEAAAVWDGGEAISYGQLAKRARRLALAFPPGTSHGAGLGAVFVPRGLEAYTAILAVLWSGRGYLPLNPSYPARRIAAILEQASPDVVVAVPRTVEGLAEPLAAAGIDPEVVVLGAGSESGPGLDREPEPKPSDVAYLLFTSGTTGRPKGVPIRHRNICAYLDSAVQRFPMAPGDRASQVFELTFDLSVHDLFVCWSQGACLVTVPDKARIAPASFLRRQELSHWFSVPSLAARMDRLGMLKPEAFPCLRHSLFCGEGLPADLVRPWARAAPHSAIDNLYGPTEATIAITGYRLEPGEEAPRVLDGLVSIGLPFEEQRAAIVDEDGRAIEGAGRGELYLSGSQVASGYWQAPDETARSFVHLDDDPALVWYRTGDMVHRDSDGNLFFLGRRDDQIKIRGFRVELLEIDSALREASGVAEAMVLPWPSRDNAETVIAFVPRPCSRSAEEILAGCRKSLPDYQVPRRVVFVPEMPRGASGKLDRRGLTRFLAEETER